MGSNLVPVAELPGGKSLQVYSSKYEGGTEHRIIPSIVNSLKPFTVPAETIEAEIHRYEELSKRYTLTAEEKAIQAAHQALADNRVLVDLSSIIDKRSNDLPYPYPVLGVARLKDSMVRCRLYENGLVQFRVGRRKVIFEFQGKRTFTARNRGDWVSREDSVPSLPPELSRTVSQEDKSKIIVWEANWKAETHERSINLDPALLEHVVGSLYSVIAVWDLSPVEAAVLGPKVH